VRRDNGDELRYRFTAWMKIVVKRAKIDYIRRIKRQPKELSIHDKSLSCKLVYEPELITNSNDFEFENKDLLRVFKGLSEKRKQILILVFVHNLLPEEVARRIGCSTQYVYNQQSLALKELRKLIEEKKNEN